VGAWSEQIKLLFRTYLIRDAKVCHHLLFFQFHPVNLDFWIELKVHLILSEVLKNSVGDMLEMEL